MTHVPTLALISSVASAWPDLSLSLLSCGMSVIRMYRVVRGIRPIHEFIK